MFDVASAIFCCGPWSDSAACLHCDLLVSQLLDTSVALVFSFRSLFLQINGTSTAWALGYVINATNVIPVDYGPSLFLHDSAFVAMVTLLAMLMFIVLLLSIAQCVRRRKSDDYLPLHQNEATSYGST